MNTGSPPLLHGEGLTVAVGARPICRALSMTLEAGQTLAIIGPNGAGKSTLLTTLAGLRPPAAGQVRLQGRPYAAWRPAEAARLRGLFAQSRTDYFAATVLDTVLVGRHPHLARWAWEGEEDERIARAALASVGLADMAGRDILTLSGGERQRVAIATLLAQDPALHLLDEPLSHLDLHHQIATLALFRQHARAGKAVAMVIHDLNLVARFADRVLLLDGTGHHAFGSVAQIMEAGRLSAAFGHPLRAVADGGQTLFVAC